MAAPTTAKEHSMYVITGITGQVGGEVARTLLAANLPVRAVVRDAAKGAVWAEKGCDIACAEMHDPAALTAAFRDAEAIFILLPPNFDPAPGFPDTEQRVTALHAALTAAKPKRVVCLSTIGAQATEHNLLNALQIMERKLGELTMPVAFLRAGWFMENLMWDIAVAQATGVVPSFLQPLDKPVPMVATADVGRTAAALLQEQWEGVRIVELEGPRRITPNEIAEVMSAILNRPVSMSSVPRGGWEDLFRFQGMKHPLPRIRMLDGFNEGWIEFEGPAQQVRKGEVTVSAVLKALTVKTATASTAPAPPANT
jgi:uncharacterized protein YbjT (DUF2867 family)